MVESVLLTCQKSIWGPAHACLAREKRPLWGTAVWKKNKKRKESVIFLVPNYNVVTVALLSRLSVDWNGMMGAQPLPNSTQVPSLLPTALSVLLISPLGTKIALKPGSTAPYFCFSLSLSLVSPAVAVKATLNSRCGEPLSLVASEREKDMSS